MLSQNFHVDTRDFLLIVNWEHQKVLFFVTQVYRVYIFLATMSNSTAEIIIKQNHTEDGMPGENYRINESEAMNIANDMVTSFGLVQALGVLFAPLNGIIIDKCKYLRIYCYVKLMIEF